MENDSLFSHQYFMHRCLQLAALGGAYVAPNPMVGAVLVYNNKIIGEGWHQNYGMPHAEVNCINSVKEEDREFIPLSAMYVSLEPCAHHGKTPPCADLIIEQKIKKVFIGCRDPFIEVNGKGIMKLLRAKVQVKAGILEKESKELNKRFLTFRTKHRPYIILKWAQTADKKIAAKNGEPISISNQFTNRLVHKWRSEEATILLGKNTAINDNPLLTNRHWSGKSPVRMVLDMNLQMPKTLSLFTDDEPLIIFNEKEHNLEIHRNKHWLRLKPAYYQILPNDPAAAQMASACFYLNLQSIMVEGGAKLLQHFINENLWDEARIITNTNMLIGEGLNAPTLKNEKEFSRQTIDTDEIVVYKNNSHAQ